MTPSAGNLRLVAIEVVGDQVRALGAPLIGVLHDRAGERALGDGAERDRVFVEGDDRDLAELAGVPQRFVHARRVVRVEADHAVDVRVGDEHVVDVGAGAGLVDVVTADVDQLEAGSLDGRVVAVDALLGVVGAGQADEADALALLAFHRLLHQLTGRRAELGVGRADIGDAVGLGRVRVEGEERDLGGDGVDRVGRGRRIDNRHRDGVDAGGDEVVHHAALDGRVGTLRVDELQFEVRQLRLGLGDGRFHDLPEVRRAIDDERNGLLVLGHAGRCRQHQGGRRNSSNHHTLHRVSSRFKRFPSG